MIGGYAYNVGYTNAILVPDNRALQARNALMTTAISLPFGMSYLVSLNVGDSEGYACYIADQSIPPFVFEDIAADSPAAAQRSGALPGAAVESAKISRPSGTPTRLPSTGGSSRERILVAGALAAAGLVTSRLARPVPSPSGVPDDGAAG